MRLALAALAFAAATAPQMVLAQTVTQPVQPIAGTRLEISATGEVSRVPDVAIISAGVVTRVPMRAATSAEVQGHLTLLRNSAGGNFRGGGWTFRVPPRIVGDFPISDVLRRTA